jgi:hypothetical protein
MNCAGVTLQKCSKLRAKLKGDRFEPVQDVQVDGEEVAYICHFLKTDWELPLTEVCVAVLIWDF